MCIRDSDKSSDHQYAVAINFQEIIEPPEELEILTESSNSSKSQSSEGAAQQNQDKPAEIEQVEQKVLETTQPEIKVPKPTPSPEVETEPIISDIVSEDSDVVAVEEEIEEDDLDFEDVPEPDPEPIPDPEPAPKTNTSIKDKAGSVLDVFNDKKGGSKDEGNPKGSPSRGDGTADGTGKGEKGDGKGSDKTGNDGDSGKGKGGLGTGTSPGSGQGIKGRLVIHRANVIPSGLTNQEGKLISVKVCFDRAGNVNHAELIEFETNAEMSRSQIKEVIAGFQKYKFEEDLSAPEETCGKLKLRISEINAFR